MTLKKAYQKKTLNTEVHLSSNCCRRKLKEAEEAPQRCCCHGFRLLTFLEWRFEGSSGEPTRRGRCIFAKPNKQRTVHKERSVCVLQPSPQHCISSTTTLASSSFTQEPDGSQTGQHTHHFNYLQLLILWMTDLFLFYNSKRT